jgi:hypothetical protein
LCNSEHSEHNYQHSELVPFQHYLGIAREPRGFNDELVSLLNDTRQHGWRWPLRPKPLDAQESKKVFVCRLENGDENSRIVKAVVDVRAPPLPGLASGAAACGEGFTR